MKKRVFTRVILCLLIVVNLTVGVLFIAQRVLPSIRLTNEYKGNQEGVITMVPAHMREPYAAFDITVEFDKEAIEILEISKGDLLQDISASREFYCNSEGSLTVLYVDYTGGDNPVSLDNNICYIRYRIKKPGRHKIDVNLVNLVRPDGTINNSVIRKGVIVSD